MSFKKPDCLIAEFPHTAVRILVEPETRGHDVREPELLGDDAACDDDGY